MAPGLGHDWNDDVVMGILVRDILQHVLSYDERRLLLARDPLCAVDGFRVLVALTHEHLFGMRVCVFRQDCNGSRNGVPRQDLFRKQLSP